MKLYLYIDRINLLNKLISQSKTGNQSELAKRLNISISRLARIIEYMKDQGAPIKFNRAKNTYYYEGRYSIKIDVKVEKINDQELKDINAGVYFYLNNYMNAFIVH